MMAALSKSLAAWAEAHGFIILCIRGPEEERFLTVSSEEVVDGPERVANAMSEAELRQHLLQAGLLEDEIYEAIDLAREWATTITKREPDAPPVLWRP